MAATPPRQGICLCSGVVAVLLHLGLSPINSKRTTKTLKGGGDLADMAIIWVVASGRARQPSGVAEPQVGWESNAKGTTCMKCLIVDDEVFCREFVAMLLKDVAHCQQAGSGKEAVELYTEALDGNAPFDLVMLDIMMPDMSGHDAAKLIRSLERERQAASVKIVMLTALNSPSDAMDSFFNAQSAAYLVKPISKDGLFDVISKLGLLRKR